MVGNFRHRLVRSILSNMMILDYCKQPWNILKAVFRTVRSVANAIGIPLDLQLKIEIEPSQVVHDSLVLQIAPKKRLPSKKPKAFCEKRWEADNCCRIIPKLGSRWTWCFFHVFVLHHMSPKNMKWGREQNDPLSRLCPRDSPVAPPLNKTTRLLEEHLSRVWS